MFIDTDDQPQGETQEQQARTLKLSEAIRIGARAIRESWHTLNNDCGCAIGAALIGYGLAQPNEYWREQDAILAISNHIGIDGDILLRTSRRHYNGWNFAANSGKYSREQIADWLEGQGL